MTSSSPFKVTSELTGNAANIGPIGNSINDSSKKQALAVPDSVIGNNIYYYFVCKKIIRGDYNILSNNNKCIFM